MNREVFRWMAGGVLVLGVAMGGCRKAEEQVDRSAGPEDGTPAEGKAYAPVMPDAAGPGETPSKLPREEGRTPDGRMVPQGRDYRTALPVPGKPGYVLNPFTNQPVDVQGIPPGTLVRDPKDPDRSHKFRIPKSASEPSKDGGNGGLTEIPVPEIP